MILGKCSITTGKNGALFTAGALSAAKTNPEGSYATAQEMEEQGVHLDMLEAVCNMYEALANAGEENNGTQALVHYYE